MKIGFLITARLKSTRLPLKLLAEINEKNVLRHVIERVKKVSGIDCIVLCTSTDPQDKPLVDVAVSEGIYYFMGDGVDVLTRLKDAARFYGIDSFLSITADNPLFCTYHANKASDYIKKNPKTDFLYMTGLPLGASVYGLRTKALDIVCKIKIDLDTEIWGPFINRPDYYSVHNMEVDDLWSFEARLTLDEPRDLLFIKELATRHDHNLSSLDLLKVKSILNQFPEIKAINSGIEQRGLDPELMSRIDKVYNDGADKIKALILDSRN